MLIYEVCSVLYVEALSQSEYNKLTFGLQPLAVYQLPDCTVTVLPRRRHMLLHLVSEVGWRIY